MESGRSHVEDFFEPSLEFARGHSLPTSQSGKVESFATEALDMIDRFGEFIHLAGSRRGLQEISRDTSQAQDASIGRLERKFRCHDQSGIRFAEGHGLDLIFQFQAGFHDFPIVVHIQLRALFLEKIQVGLPQKIFQSRQTAELKEGRVGGDEFSVFVLRKKRDIGKVGEGRGRGSEQRLQFRSGGFRLCFQVSKKYKK